jgi:hypothetical protein
MNSVYRMVLTRLYCPSEIKTALILSCVLNCFISVSAQQFNSDSWLSKPHGTVTIIPTTGQRNSMLMTTYSLFPKWEFTIAGYMYNDDGDPLTADGYSASLYAKYMFYQNKKETGGASVKFGTGMEPGTIGGEEREKNAFQSYWINFPCTIPFFNNKFSWDLMPGVSQTQLRSDKNDRLGLYLFYPIGMESVQSKVVCRGRSIWKCWRDNGHSRI